MTSALPPDDDADNSELSPIRGDELRAQADNWFLTSATEPVFGIPIGEVVLTNVHDPSRCEGRGCSIHHPSDHSMRDWPSVFRSDKHMFERTCKHGVGHPDPDDVAWHASQGRDWAGVHGCCGCCRPVESSPVR